MGIIRNLATGEELVLEAHHLVGRSEHCTLRLSRPHVSAEHASLSWDGAKWLVRDLGSTNRTFVDGKPLPSSGGVPVAAGQSVAFGDVREAFVVIADEGPSTLAQPLHGGLATHAENGLLALPSGERPMLTIYRNTQGEWVMDTGGAIQPVLHRAVLEVDGMSYRLFLPEARVETTPLASPVDRSVANIGLEFLVSRDEEHIELRTKVDAEIHDLGARAHNYLVLFLARRRLEDVEAGQPPPACGWVFQEEVCEALKVDPERLNVDVYRVRRQFAAFDLADPAEIIQRRPRTKQLRIGTALCRVQGI
jgi:hypothetical protein